MFFFPAWLLQQNKNNHKSLCPTPPRGAGVQQGLDGQVKAGEEERVGWCDGCVGGRGSTAAVDGGVLGGRAGCLVARLALLFRLRAFMAGQILSTRPVLQAGRVWR
jgi:hypothetical protein